MTLKYKNNAQTTLSAGINDSVTSIAVVDGSVFPTLTGIEYFYMTLEDVSLNREVVKVTARSGNTLTVVRAQDGSVARAFSIGDKAEGRLVAAMLADLSAPSYILAALLTVDGTGSTLDADLLDGQSSAYYLAAGSYTAADVLSKLLTVDGAGSGLDADLLDGQSSAYYLAAGSYTAADVLSKLLTVDGTGSGLDADLLDGQSSAYYLAAGSYTAADVLSKLLTVDGAGSGLDADTVDTYHVGTSGATIPLLNGANTWSGGQTFNADMALKTSGDQYVYFGAAGVGTFNLSRNGVGGVLTVSSANVVNFPQGSVQSGGVAIPTISSTDTLSNKTLSSPTVSGTIAGAATWTGTQTFNASQSFNGASGVGAIKVLGAGGSWFWIDNPSSTVLRFSSGAAPGTNSMTYTDAGVLAVAGSITAGGNTVWHAGNDGAGSGLDADLLDGYNIGTSGGTIPLLNGTNTWSNAQIAPSFTVSNTSSGAPQMIHYVSDAGADNKRWWNYANSGQMYWQLVNDAFNATTTWMNVTRSGMTVSSIALSSNAFTWNGVAIPTISSTDTLSNKTLSSPTINTPTIVLPTIRANGSHEVAVFNQQTPGSYNLDVQWQDNGAVRWLTSVRVNSNDDFWLYNWARGVADISVSASSGVVALVNGATGQSGVAIPTISSTDTLTNKTLSSPTLSGTVAGNPTFSGTPSFGTSTGVRWYAYSTSAANSGAGVDLSGNGYELSLFAGGNLDAAGRISFGRRRSDTGTYTERMYLDLNTGALVVGGNTAWHAGNDGAGSGLDADLLDGLSSAAFAQLSASNTFTGAAQYLSNSSAVGLITVSNYPYSDWRDSDGAADAKNWRFEVGGNTAGFYLYNDAFSGGSVGLYMNRSGTTATTLTWANNTVWHAGNDGAGSGLDADLLDGYSSASFVFQNQSYTASTISFTGIGGNSGNGVADYNIYQESGAWTHPYPDLIFAYHTGIKIMSTTGYGGTKFYGATPSYIGATDPLFIVGNIDNATSHISHPVTSPTTDGFGLEFLLNGTYADGRYAHRLAKYDAGGGAPLYMQKTSGTAGAWTTIARFGSFSGNDREFEVFGRTAVTAGDNSYTTYGPNTSYAAYLHVGSGNPPSRATKNASIIATDGNLHIDSGGAQQIYLNYYVDQPIYAWRQILYQGAHTFWHAANDGAGSGLDADLLDGYNVGTSGAAIGLLNAAWTRGNTTTFSQGYGVNFANSGATHGIFDYNNTTLILAYNTGDWTSSVRISSGNTQIYAGGNAMTYDGSTLTVSAGAITASGDGIHRHGSGTDTPGMSGTSPLLYVNGLYATGIAAKRTGSYAEVGMQSGSRAYLGSYNAFEVNFVRNNVAILEMNATNLLHLATGGTYWHSGNDGSGSTLDADTVDNVHASQIVYGGSTGKSLGDQSNMNSNTLRSGFYYYNNPSNGPIADWQNWIQVRGDGWGDGNQYGFQISSAFHSNNLYYRRHANASYDSWFNMWHSGSDGSGSGLDADLLDGYNADINANASTVAVRSSAGDLNVSSIYASNWFRSTGGSGWYNQTFGGGIFMQDTTYVKVYGGKAFYVPNSIDATGNITAYYSDERLKTKTRNVENALDQVSSLTPFFYVENETARSLGYNNLKEQVGLSAQEVQRILPQVVHRAPVDIAVDENGNKYSKSGEDYLTVDYARVVPLLVAAIKELRAEVTELKRTA